MQTALDDCTSGCKVVYNKDGLVTWDIAGDDQSFKYYDAETLSFIKDLDKCIILFDDINCNQNIIKVIHAIKGDNIMVVRNKCDQRDVNDIRTVKEVKQRDTEKLKALGVDGEVLCISARDAVNENYSHDWEDFAKFIC